MGQIILILVGAILGTLGTVMVYDARVLTKKLFGFGDQNEGSMGMKIIGFIIGIIGAIIVFVNLG